MVARLLIELPDWADPGGDLVERGRVLDTFYIPARYPNAYPEGAPFKHYGRLQSLAGRFQDTLEREAVWVYPQD